MKGQNTGLSCAAVMAAALAVTAASSGCSEDSHTPKPADASGDAAVDAGTDASEAGAAADASVTPEAGSEAGAGSGLAGIVKDRSGALVSNAKVEVGGVSAFSDTQGKYALAGLAAGPATVKVTRDWFKPLETSATIAASGVTALDLTIEAMPLKIDPADQALAASYNKTFDWTRQSLSIAIAARPTRRDFDNAVYFRNPALYRDTSQMAPLTPAPQPEITGGAAKSFSFPLRSGANQGKEALDLTSIVDAIKDTPFGPTEPADFLVWTPVVSWLGESDAASAAELKAVGTAVLQQTWGSNAIRPQQLEKVYLDTAHKALWVKVVFAGFVQLGPGVSDDDGDGLKEIYARVAATQVPAAVFDRLASEYGKAVLDTFGLSKEVSKSLSELYSSTSAQVERFIGQPFEAPGVGTIMYPFVVLKHSGGQRNVILVAPGP
jgi:hypothetical protein